MNVPELIARRAEAEIIKRQQQQGFGRLIESRIEGDHRVLKIGIRQCKIPATWTFPGFLQNYADSVIGKNWFLSQKALPKGERHPLARIRRQFQIDYNAQWKGDAPVQTITATGAINAYTNFAYHLYLCEHNGVIARRMLNRLKNPRQFHGAQHELYVTATFLKAGFSIDHEDERDSSLTHCEFTATHRHTGQRYSVEAKAKQPETNSKLGGLLAKAIQKEASHSRIIWLASNSPAFTAEDVGRVIDMAVEESGRKESEWLAQGKEPPQAHLIISNHSDLYALNSLTFAGCVHVEPFNIPDYKTVPVFPFRAARLWRDKHSAVLKLQDSIMKHDAIPQTFDGEDPLIAYGKPLSPRPLLGEKHPVQFEDGSTVTGVFAQIVMLEGRPIGLFEMDDGTNCIVELPLFPQEVLVAQKHPDTFFGVPELGLEVNPKNPFDFYEMFLSGCQSSPREILLGQLREIPGIGEIDKMTQSELAILWAEKNTELFITTRMGPTTR